MSWAVGLGVWVVCGYVAFRQSWAAIERQFQWSATPSHRRAELWRCVLWGPLTLPFGQRAGRAAFQRSKINLLS